MILVSCLPPDVLYFDDLIEALVFGKLSEDGFQVLLVAVENLQEIGGNFLVWAHAEFFEPAIPLADLENSTENVADVATTANIGGEGTIRNGNENCSGVVQHDVEVLDFGHSDFHLVDWHVNFSCELGPSLLHIVCFVDVKRA